MSESGKDKTAIDSICTVNVSNDKMEAYISVSSPVNGGADITHDIIMQTLERFKVVFGVDKELIDSIVKEKRYNQEYLIAVAKPSVAGENGKITYNYSKKAEAELQEDVHGFVDYKNLNLIRIVHKGDVIAEITPPTDGEEGTNVCGGILHQVKGKKASYTVGKNTYVSEDGTQIIASVEGQLVFKNGAFHVEQVLLIAGDVDSSVGNLDFTGDIIIKGDVCEGFKVTSATNIQVTGNVNGAVLEAGGGIVVKKGCINSRLTSRKCVTAQFFEHCNVECDEDLSAQTYILCNIYCKGVMRVTKSNGTIIGGKLTLLNSLSAPSIGSKTYINTEIVLGNNAMLAEEKVKLCEKVKGLEKTIDDLAKIVNFLNEKKKMEHKLPEDKEKLLGDAARQKIVHTVGIKNALKQIAEIDNKLKDKQLLSVSCKGYLYPGIHITINDAVFKVEQEYINVTVAINDEGVVEVRPYNK